LTDEPSEISAYIRLNIQTPCPPRGAVPVNQGRTWESFSILSVPVRFRSWMRPSQLCKQKIFSNGVIEQEKIHSDGQHVQRGMERSVQPSFRTFQQKGHPHPDHRRLGGREGNWRKPSPKGETSGSERVNCPGQPREIFHWVFHRKSPGQPSWKRDCLRFSAPLVRTDCLLSQIY
jgi:hypothetical protein